MKVINLISGPRNISTALLYSFAQRGDFRVFDEPFYGYYLDNATLNITHPLHSEIVNMMECDEKKVVTTINAAARTSHVFIKGMAHHFLSEAPKYLLNWTNVILIRHPKKLIASFSKVIPNPTLTDIGIKKTSELVSFLKKNGKAHVVIDSDQLMINPKRYLQKIFDIIELPFSEAMLTWQTGGIPEDGIWAKYWYRNVHQTTGFRMQNDKSVQIPRSLNPLLEEALPFYKTLQNNILIND